ncbi:MAG: hypothetical protein ABW189_05600 [Rickettsiales bacterium]
MAKTRILSVAPKLAPQLARLEKPSDVERCLSDALREALEGVAKGASAGHGDS